LIPKLLVKIHHQNSKIIGQIALSTKT